MKKKVYRSRISVAKEVAPFAPSLDSTIDVNYRSNEVHRAFFKQVIGEKFRFNVPFMQWMEANRGQRTYREAVAMYRQLAADKRAGKKYPIWPQFEYNQYVRDFFADNPHAGLRECIRCWHYKKRQAGTHRYEPEDLKHAACAGGQNYTDKEQLSK